MVHDTEHPDIEPAPITDRCPISEPVPSSRDRCQELEKAIRIALGDLYGSRCLDRHSVQAAIAQLEQALNPCVRL